MSRWRCLRAFLQCSRRGNKIAKVLPVQGGIFSSLPEGLQPHQIGYELPSSRRRAWIYFWRTRSYPQLRHLLWVVFHSSRRRYVLVRRGASGDFSARSEHFRQFSPACTTSQPGLDDISSPSLPAYPVGAWPAYPVGGRPSFQLRHVLTSDVEQTPFRNWGIYLPILRKPYFRNTARRRRISPALTTYSGGVWATFQLRQASNLQRDAFHIKSPPLFANRSGKILLASVPKVWYT